MSKWKLKPLVLTAHESGKTQSSNSLHLSIPWLCSNKGGEPGEWSEPVTCPELQATPNIANDKKTLLPNSMAR
jgi:hypothetical protein